MIGRLRWTAALMAVACLIVALLWVAGWRLLEAERTLARQRMRERLENAASLVGRESERALARAASDPGSLEVRWQNGVLRRSGGAPLLWSPSPGVHVERSRAIWAAAEGLEFGAGGPERALRDYRALARSPDRGVRAGALLRIARCQRRLSRTADALETYRQLLSFRETGAGGAPAELVALRERAALLQAAGETAEAVAERVRLRATLEEGRYPIDSATFEFYAESLPISPSARARAQAVEQFWKRAGDFARGTEVIRAAGRHYVAEWSREGSGGTGRLVELAALERGTSETLRSSGVRWQLVDAHGTRLAGAAAAPAGLLKRAGETGLPWGVLVEVPPEAGASSASLLIAGLVVLGLSILATLYLAYRTVRRELHVAEMQSEFVAAVSHEFRTPITALTHLTEMLETGCAAEERKPAYYSALARETRRLREMVENLLDFGRMESGRYRHKPETIDVERFVREIVEEFREQPAAARHDLAFESERGEYAVSADREILRRAVWNLLDNAVKYSPAGKRILASVHAADGCIGVSVEDAGPGIPSDERKMIFQKFVRGRSAHEGRVRGTGIGLAMVDAIARAHGGRVELRSRPGEGSRFTILLPRQEHGCRES